MKTRPNRAIRELRNIIGRTQGEFAAMIGASKDAVASWETGRNRLSEPFARRMALATGVDAKALMRGRGALTCYVSLSGRQPFSQATFEQYRGTYRQWRAMQKDDPTMCRIMRFRDDPRKRDSENVQLEAETIPIWRSGHPMRGNRLAPATRSFGKPPPASLETSADAHHP